MGKGQYIRIGVRFCERMSAELQQAATYAARKNWKEAERCYQEHAQMLDTYLQETGLAAYLEGKDDADEVQPTAVAAESEPAEDDTRIEKKVTKRTKATRKPGNKKRSPNGGSSSASSS